MRYPDMPMRGRRGAVRRPTPVQAGTGAPRPKRASLRVAAASAVPAIVAAGKSAKAETLIRLIREHRLPPFHPEWPFARSIKRRWRFDLAWPAYMVAVEIEGGIFGKGSGEPCALCGEKPKGAHGSVSGILRDIAKYNAGTMLGWRIYRVPTNRIDRDAVREIERLLMASGWSRPAKRGSRPRPLVSTSIQAPRVGSRPRQIGGKR